MKNEKTQYAKLGNIKLTLILILLYIGFVAILVYCTRDLGFVPIFILLFMMIPLLLSIIGAILGIIKGKSQISKENKYIEKINPYIYYRELPNNFGIGVTTILLDSTIENYKDIVAVILDLCAKKYINLTKQNDKYVIQLLKDIDDNLLYNEKYILYLLKNNNIKNIDYKEWFDYCLQDSISLGLCERPKHQKLNYDSPNTAKVFTHLHSIKRFLIISSIILSILTFNIVFVLLAFFIFFILSQILPGIYGVFFLLVDSFKRTFNMNYRNVMTNNLSKTQNGIDELHKLYSFKAFLNDFGNFVSKNIEEVILWDRYLSYAQVFGLTKEIMNSGYEQLVDNSSFQIDNIDNINLDNIEVN